MQRENITTVNDHSCIEFWYRCSDGVTMNGYDNWNLEGKIATFLYVGAYKIEGLINCSRVAYGGNICHHFEFLEDFEVRNGRTHIKRDKGEGSVVDHSEIISIRDNNQ